MERKVILVCLTYTLMLAWLLVKPILNIKDSILLQPYLGECEDETHIPKIWDLGVLRDSRNFKVRLQGLNTLHLGVLLFYWKVIEV
jgi:hypothetical protein